MNSLPALRFRFLTRFYDVFLRVTMPVEDMRAMIVRNIPQPTTRILDFGCGTGELLVRLSDAYPDSTLSGLDPDPEALTLAAGKISGRPNIALHISNGSATAIPGPHFDVVVCSLVLHHLAPQNLLRTLQEFQRTLSPEGTLLVLDWQPSTGFFQTLLFNATRVFDGWQRTAVFADGAFMSAVKASGFSKVEILESLHTTFGNLALYRIRP